MDLDISKHGDVLERTYCDILKNRLPAYIEIWKRYIGNNGEAKMLDIPKLDEDDQHKRHIFAQFHYSCFESVISLKYISDRFCNSKILSIQDYVQANNDFLAFQAHSGRIRDCVARLGEMCKINNLELGLNDFYQQRNEILHGCKIPFMLLDGFIAIPKPKGAEESEEAWNSTKTWSEVKSKDFELLQDYFAQMYDSTTTILNKCLFQVLDYIKKLIKEQSLQLSIPTDLDQRFAPTVSGVLDNHFFIDASFSVSASIK